MKVEVRLFTSLRINREKKYIMEVEPGATPMLLAEMLDIQPKEIQIILINGRVCKEAAHEVQNGDIISFFPAVGGG